MKLRVKDRIALAVYCLVVIGLAALLAMYMGPWGYVIAALVAVFSVYILWLAVQFKPHRDKNSVSVQTNDQGNGEVRVSVQALDTLVKQAVAGHTEGIAEIKTGIVNHDDSISVKVEMVLNGDAHIPNITMLLQSSIKGFIEEFSGIAVREVGIMVKSVVPVLPQIPCEEQAKPALLEEEAHLEELAEPAPGEEPAQEEAPPADEPTEEDEPAAEEAQEEACFSEEEEAAQDGEADPLPIEDAEEQAEFEPEDDAFLTEEEPDAEPELQEEEIPEEEAALLQEEDEEAPEEMQKEEPKEK
ncbi:MAG: alkaline shock response membrane anchor protein AmaP [Eubacteriales bacterium]|nr:alkaline shock response membrane anchor protein AmaP [Eubacteriales bacterium]